MATVVIGVNVWRATAQEPTNHDAHYTADSPLAVASAYLDAMEAANLDAAEALFAKRSLVFESGGVEGSWDDYRARHIGPELHEFASFVIARGEPEEGRSGDGTLVWVAWPIEYTIVLTDGRVIESRGTVTFVMVREEGTYGIRHLHWSSRRKPAAPSG